MTPKGPVGKSASANWRLTTAAPMVLSYNIKRAAASEAFRRRHKAAAGRGARRAEEAVMLIGKRGAASTAISIAGSKRGVPILARTSGLIARLGEEARTPIGFSMASQAEAPP